VRANGVDDRRWVRVGTITTTHAEITGGLKAGEVIVMPAASNGTTNGATNGSSAPSPKAGT
jgi:hypothetical protein